MSTCDQRTDSQSPVSEHNSLSGKSDSRLTKAIEREVCGGRIVEKVLVRLEDSFEGCNQQKLCPYQMATVNVKMEAEEEEDDSSQQPAAVEDDCSQQHYLIPGYNMIFIKEEAYEEQAAEGSSVKSEPEMWPSNGSTSGRDYATEVGGLNEHSISPVKCTESSVAGKKIKLHSCAHCSYETARSTDFKRHIRKHTGEKPFNCKFCDYKSARLGHLKTHTRTHTGEKPFSCEFCDFKSAKLDNMKRHIRTHTAEKPFSCEFCDYKSARLGTLKDHIRTHTGEKPFSCKFCDYKSARLGHLKAHIRTHTGEKPFSCEFCDYKCAQSCHLKEHNIRKHTG
ncbi:transcriptional repressor CTCF isoform X4 [Nilaparvata lugens]|nr:transcriptional repressor CTCF isoform X4 [Nilaparvata lugens]XP_039300012.1 transcriptional repressor CTCF isoform X4 [Nilaparvata lugens]